MTTPHLDRIDSIRGLAILLVFAFHTLLIIFPGFEYRKYGADGIIEVENLQAIILSFNPFGQGWIGVDLFLVISGFLIHLIHLRSGTTLDLKTFFSKRFWRIFPPYLFVLLVFFFMKMDTSPQGLKHLFSHVFLIHNLDDDTFFSINPSFWSIALECQLYLIYPLYLVLLKHFGAGRSFFIAILMNITLTTYAVITGISSLAYGTFVLKMWIVWCAGAYLADRFHNGKRLFKHPALWFLAAYLLFCMFKSYFITSRYILLPATLTCLAIMEVMLYYEKPLGFLGRNIFNKLGFLGLCSYSIYLIHQPYLGNLLSYFDPGTAFVIIDRFTGIGLSWAIIILISFMMYKMLELKSIAFGQRLRAKSKKARQSE